MTSTLGSSAQLITEQPLKRFWVCFGLLEIMRGLMEETPPKLEQAWKHLEFVNENLRIWRIHNDTEEVNKALDRPH